MTSSPSLHSWSLRQNQPLCGILESWLNLLVGSTEKRQFGTLLNWNGCCSFLWAKTWNCKFASKTKRLPGKTCSMCQHEKGLPETTNCCLPLCHVRKALQKNADPPETEECWCQCRCLPCPALAVPRKSPWVKNGSRDNHNNWVWSLNALHPLPSKSWNKKVRLTAQPFHLSLDWARCSSEETLESAVGTTMPLSVVCLWTQHHDWQKLIQDCSVSKLTQWMTQPMFWLLMMLSLQHGQSLSVAVFLSCLDCSVSTMFAHRPTFVECQCFFSCPCFDISQSPIMFRLQALGFC